MTTNPLKALHDHDQSFWVDYIDRELVARGGIQRLIEDDGLRGLTSNPSIFEAAISGSGDYDADIEAVLGGASSRPETVDVYETLAVQDIRAAADALRGVYDASEGRDGFVSFEVSPHLARDTKGTVAEARRLWGWVDRPNLMIKVPATPEGMPAIEELIAGGVNVNVTLIFSVETHYEGAAMAFIEGVERNADPARVASVASFFVSRVDTAVDAELERIRDAGGAGRPRQGGSRQREAGLRAVSPAVPHRAVRAAASPRRPPPTRPLGQHQHQEPPPTATSSTSRN